MQLSQACDQVHLKEEQFWLYGTVDDSAWGTATGMLVGVRLQQMRVLC